jgi:hypothetical protein
MALVGVALLAADLVLEFVALCSWASGATGIQAIETTRPAVPRSANGRPE